VDDIEKALDKIGLHSKQIQNIARQEKEVAKSQSNPGEIDLETLVPEMEGLMGVDPGARWQSLFEQYGPNFYDDFSSRKKKLDEIKDNAVPVVHTRPLNKNGLPVSFIPGYAKLLHEARGEATQDLKDATRNLDNLLKTGYPLLAKPKTIKDGAWSATKKVGGGLGEVALSAANGLRSLVNYAGRGIYSKSDPNYNKSLQRYYDHRNQIFSNLLWSLNPRQSESSAAMKRCQQILNNSRANLDGLMDQDEFEKMLNILTQEMKNADKEHAAQIKQMTQRINDLNKQVVETARSETQDSDDMMKWRFLQAALMISPFMGLSILGPVTDIISQVLMNPAGLGHGIASLANFFPPFEWLQIDKVIEWLLCDIPGISHAVDLVNTVVCNEPIRLIFGGMIVPLALSPAAALAVGAVSGVVHGAKEAQHYEKYRDAFKNHKKALDAEMAKISKEAELMGKDWDPSAFVKKQFDVLREFKNKTSLVDFALGAARRSGDAVRFLKEIMGDDFEQKMLSHERIEKDAAGQDVIHKVIDNNGKIKDAEFMNFISSIPNEEFFEKMLLCSALDSRRAAGFQTPLSLPQELQEMIKDPKAAGLIEKQKTKQNEIFLLDLATNLGVDCSSLYGEKDPKKREELFGDLEKSLKDAQTQFFKENTNRVTNAKLAHRILPTSSPQSVSFSNLSSQSQRAQTTLNI